MGQFVTQDGGHGGSRLIEVALHKRRPEHCHEALAGGWTYRVCIGDEVWQSRGEQKNPHFSLGTHVSDKDHTLPDGAFASVYEGGTDGRKATVILRCTHQEAYLEASEPKVMEYVVEAWLPSVCSSEGQWKSSYVIVCLVVVLNVGLFCKFFAKGICRFSRPWRSAHSHRD